MEKNFYSQVGNPRDIPQCTMTTANTSGDFSKYDLSDSLPQKALDALTGEALKNNTCDLMYRPWRPSYPDYDKCPNCGYCPHCGRGGNKPYWPYSQPYWMAQTSGTQLNAYAGGEQTFAQNNF